MRHRGHQLGVLYCAFPVALASISADTDVHGFLDVGVAYVQFSSDLPAHFSVMFPPDLIDVDDPPKKHENVLGPRHVVGNMVYNNMPDSQNTTITVSDTVGPTDSIQIAASAKVSIMKIVKATVTTTYGHTWMNSHTFTQAEQLSIRPYLKGPGR